MRMLHCLCRFQIRALLTATFAAAIFLHYVIAPEIQRRNAFRILKTNGMVIRPPIIVMFGGQQETTIPIREPDWFAIRQRAAQLCGINVEPWLGYCRLSFSNGKPDKVMALIDSCGDLKILATRDDYPSWQDSDATVQTVIPTRSSH